MRDLLVNLSFLLLTLCVFAQTPGDIGAANSHEHYVAQLSNSKDQNFEEVLYQYDQYIQNYPRNIIAKIERCKFIGNSYWDEYEDYNLKWEETDACIADLYANHPENPKVLIYRAENFYGEELLQVLEEAEQLIIDHPNQWSDTEIAAINEMLGNYHSENNTLALKYFLKAQRLNNNLDLSLAIARIYIDQGRTEKAKEVLLPSLEKDTMLWKMNQKANVLIELKEAEKALQLYDLIGQRDSSFIDNSEMAKAMIELGDYKTAREFLVRDTIAEWNKAQKLQQLLAHDMTHADAKTTLTTYRSLQKQDSYDDFLGIKRLRIFFKNPMLLWKTSESFHFFLFVLSLALLFLLPYLWVLPIHYLGSFLRGKSRAITSKLNFNWSMRHFWLISFLYLLVQYLLVIVFYYQDNINYYFDVVTAYGDDVEESASLARSTVFFISGMGVCTLLMLKKNTIKHLFQTNMHLFRIFGLSIGFVIVNMIFLRVLGIFVDLTDNDATNILLSAREEIIALLDTYGFGAAFLLVAVIGPVYEEIIFRGIILGAVEKRLGFVLANVIQAALFALVHFDLALFIFFFFFGLVTGHFTSKTKGLLTGMIFHGVHNFAVLLAIYFLMGIAA